MSDNDLVVTAEVNLPDGPVKDVDDLKLEAVSLTPESAFSLFRELLHLREQRDQLQRRCGELLEELRALRREVGR